MQQQDIKLFTEVYNLDGRPVIYVNNTPSKLHFEYCDTFETKQVIVPHIVYTDPKIIAEVVRKLSTKSVAVYRVFDPQISFLEMLVENGYTIRKHEMDVWFNYCVIIPKFKVAYRFPRTLKMKALLKIWPDTYTQIVKDTPKIKVEEYYMTQVIKKLEETTKTDIYSLESTKAKQVVKKANTAKKEPKILKRKNKKIKLPK